MLAAAVSPVVLSNKDKQQQHRCLTAKVYLLLLHSHPMCSYVHQETACGGPARTAGQRACRVQGRCPMHACCCRLPAACVDGPTFMSVTTGRSCPPTRYTKRVHNIWPPPGGMGLQAGSIRQTHAHCTSRWCAATSRRTQAARQRGLSSRAKPKGPATKPGGCWGHGDTPAWRWPCS